MAPILLLWLGWVSTQAPDALLEAARDGDVAKVRTLLAAGADANVADADGRTALIFAAGHDDEQLIELLLDAGADPGLRDAEGVSALTVAKAESSTAIIARLREAGARESREELLDEAVRAGDLDAVSELLEGEELDVNALDTDDYQTPLMTALELRELEIFLRLVRAGADPTVEGTGIRTTGENAISVAARQQSPWALRVLLESRARQSDLNRALLLGCGSAAVVGVAIEAGANVNAKGRDDETPLMCAAAAGSADAVAVLLEEGAEVNAVSVDGRTAADRAKENGFLQIEALLTR